MRRYVHIGTGNYNPKTARLYTDFGLLSADPDLGADLTDLFNVLTGFASPAGYRQADRGAARACGRGSSTMIRREAEHARAGRPARIMAKMNALVDPDVIVALYEASPGGRGDRPDRPRDLLPPAGAAGRQRHDPGDQHRRPLPRALAARTTSSTAAHEEVYIGSADWMPRNLDRRIEAVGAGATMPHHRQTIYARSCSPCGRTTARPGTSVPTASTAAPARAEPTGARSKRMLDESRRDGMGELGPCRRA